MVAMHNPFTKTITWVADDRVDEYKAAGFVPVADLEKPEVEVEEPTEEPKEEPVEAEPSEEIEEPKVEKESKKSTGKKAKK